MKISFITKWRKTYDQTKHEQNHTVQFVELKGKNICWNNMTIDHSKNRDKMEYKAKAI